MTMHTGHWLINEQDDGGLAVTSRHTVRINTENITRILGETAALGDAREFVRNALSANSLATLGFARTYAEQR